MKKCYSLLLAGVLSGMITVGALTVPYASPIADKSSKSVSPDWTIVDNNNDGRTWAFDGDDNNLTAVTGTDCGLKYQYHTSNAADDWAVSPAFDFQEGHEYVISYWLKETSAGKEAFKVYVGTSSDVALLGATAPLASFDKNIGTTWRHEKIMYTAPATGAYHIGFQVCSTKNQYNLLLRGFSIKENIITPAAPSALAAEAADGDALAAHLTWTLPEVDDEGTPLPEALSAVNVFREGVQVATLAGDATEYTDNLPAPGAYTYAVSVTMGTATSTATEVRTLWIGPKTPQALPFAENFKDADFYNAFWTTIDIDQDAKPNGNSAYPPLSNAWCFQSNLMKSATWAVIYTSRNAQVAENDWLVSPPLAFPGPGKYKVSFKLAMYSGIDYGCHLSVYAGDGDTPEAMYIPVTVIESVSKSTLNPADEMVPLLEYEFETDKGGTFYIGFHAGYRATDIERRLQMGAFGVELVELYEVSRPVYTAPFNSADIEGWQPVPALDFALESGYYHAGWSAEGEVSVSGGASADSGFSPDFVVIRTEAPGQVCFAADSFEAFVIESADHTPAAPETCTCIENEDGSMTFKIQCPALNAAGGALYEITHAEILESGEVVARISNLQPGYETEYTLPAPETLRIRREAEGSPYTVVLHNLSGASVPAQVHKTLTGVETVSTSSADGGILYRLDGTPAPASAARGIYVRVSASGAHKVVIR